MKLGKIRRLIALVQETGIAELEIQEDKESVRIVREALRPQAAVMPPAYMVAESQAASSGSTAKSAEQNNVEAAQAAGPEKHSVKSPMVGTVYLAPSPGAKAFVEIGQQVKTGDVVCLIEAMKMFNQIEADKSGTITALLVESGSPVEFNQPLLVIE